MANVSTVSANATPGTKAKRAKRRLVQVRIARTTAFAWMPNVFASTTTQALIAVKQWTLFPLCARIEAIST